ncbi:MAG: RNB domain-containing ribonuclease [Coriobacteriales bacterium]|jgi:ribonuclease R|nr:RNB domain-containing ribonuclease [Coriobacteriales bacterium]
MARRNHKARRKPSQVSVGVIHIAHRGYGFVDTSEGEYFVLPSKLHGAMDGDVVEVVRLRRLEQRRRDTLYKPWINPDATVSERLGSVRRVLERAHETLIGTVRYDDGLGVVCPHDVRIAYDVFLDHRAFLGKTAENGDVVVVRLTTYPSRLEAAQGYIEEVIGREDDRSLGIEVVIRQHGFETVFAAAALEEAAALLEESGGQLPSLWDRGPDALLPRRDLRERFIFTIDPADAKDFDDALSVDFIDGQMRLGVHIADVSAFVAWDSALDLNARRRATSIYLPDRVIPMLPPQISEELCSLKPYEDRYAFTVDMLMNADGSVASSELYPSLIRSSARLTYDEAQDMLHVGASATPSAPTAATASGIPAVTAADLATSTAASASTATALHGRLHALNKLAKRLTRRRLARGAIDFEGIEAKLTLDADGVPTAVRLRTQTDATSLIEEAMILANEQIAAHMLQREAPMVYRVHDEPTLRALEELLPTLQEFGYARQGVPQTSREIQDILEASAGTPEHHLVSALLLRAMKRAKYLPLFTTHFGLASRGYTHFTSPIRRYPDLMAHRLLKYQLAAEQEARRGDCGVEGVSVTGSGTVFEAEGGFRTLDFGTHEPPSASKLRVPSCPPSMTRQLDWICEHSSQMEREAEQAAREATALKLCEYLAPRTGERFSGIITAVNTAGFTVREDTTTAEGFVSVEDLPRAFAYDQARQRYHNPTVNASYRLGQPVEVILKQADLPRSRLIFTLPEG